MTSSFSSSVALTSSGGHAHMMSALHLRFSKSNKISWILYVSRARGGKKMSKFCERHICIAPIAPNSFATFSSWSVTWSTEGVLSTLFLSLLFWCLSSFSAFSTWNVNFWNISWKLLNLVLTIHLQSLMCPLNFGQSAPPSALEQVDSEVLSQGSVKDNSIVQSTNWPIW